MYPSYLIHFNRQHDPKTGKFTFGDGDGDGISNDHGHPKDNKNSGDNKNTKSVITTSSDKSGKNFIERKPGGNTYRFKDTTGKETVYRPERETFKERDVISGKQTTIGSDRYNSIKPRLNRDFTREGTGKLVRVGDTNAGSKLLLDQSNREKTTYRQALTRDGGTGKLVQVGDTKVGNYVKGKRQKNPNGDKPGEQSDGTKSKDTHVKLPGQPITRVKDTYEKIPDGPYKPKYKKVQTQESLKDEEMSTEEKYNTHRLNAVSNFIDDVINSDEDENKKPRNKKPMSNSEKVSAEEKGRKFVLKTIDRMLNKLT